MAAEGLEQAARAAGHEIEVETQGAAGLTPLSPETIAAADAVIFAADVGVRQEGRFAGKPLVRAGVKKAISDGPGLIAAAVAAAEEAAANPAAAQTGSPAPAAGGLSTKVDSQASVGVRIRQWLMTGVSYMIPFVAAGGILIALGFMVAQSAWGQTGVVKVKAVPLDTLISGFNFASGQDWAALLFQIGAASFGFLVPILAGFIAFAIADRPGLVPGVVGGALAVVVGAGFLGGMAAGFIGGFAALWISSWKVPKGMRGIMPVVVIPLLSVLITGFTMIVVLGRPLKALTDGLASWLHGLSGANLILLGVILGLMMAFDMGGPVNKVAYTFATTGLATAAVATGSTNLKVMAAVMAAGMTPPLGLALATTVRRRLFSEAERENGQAAWLLGASFITEGAIPFAAADPLRVIPSCMLGSAVTGGLVMAFGNTLRAPHGGIWVTPLISSPLLYLIAVAIGTVITAAAVVALKAAGPGPVKTELDDAEATAAVAV